MKIKLISLILLTSVCAAAFSGCGAMNDTAYVANSAEEPQQNECPDGECPDDGCPDGKCPDDECPDGNCHVKKPRVIFKRRGGSAVGFYGCPNGTFFFVIGNGDFDVMPLPDDGEINPPETPSEPQIPEN